MFIVSPTSRGAAPHDRLTVSGGRGSVVVLIDANSAPDVQRGEVATVKMEAGATLSLTRGSWEVALYVIAGRTQVSRTALGPDDAVFVPAGIGIKVQSLSAAKLLVVSHPAADAGVAEPCFLLHGEVPTRTIHDTRLGFLHMSARWLVTGPAAGSVRIAVGQSGFEPYGGAHVLHRHHDASEFLFVLEGQGAHLSDDGEHPMQQGDAASIPAGEWHGFACRGDRTTRAVFGYFGVNSPASAGYELRQIAAET